jgi:hypothetical protein
MRDIHGKDPFLCGLLRILDAVLQMRLDHGPANVLSQSRTFISTGAPYLDWLKWCRQGGRSVDPVNLLTVSAHEIV